MEPSGICLIKRVRPGVCPCEHNAMALSTQNDPEVCVLLGYGRCSLARCVVLCVCVCVCVIVCALTLQPPQVVEVFEDDVKKRLVKCASISVDRPKAYDIPTKVSVAWRGARLPIDPHFILARRS